MTIDEIVQEAAKIQGWMNEAELRWLAEQASKRYAIVEFGCHKGRSTKALSLATKGQVTAVDLWKDQEVFTEFGTNFLREIDEGKVVVWRGSTFAFPEIHSGMVFIDADHDYPGISLDIQKAYRMLNGHGLLCGHNFSNDYPGVQSAVRLLVPGFKRVPGGDIWYKEL